MKRKLILLPIIVIVACIALTFVLVKFGREVKPVETEPYTPFVEISEVILSPEELMVQSQGTVIAATRIPLISELDGLILEISDSFKEGGVFNKGDVLLRIDDTDYKAMLAQARSQLATARVQLETMQAEADLAQADWKEMESMKLGSPSPLLFREPQLEGARAALLSAEAAFEKASKDLDRTLLRAPFTGRVVNKMADKGQFVRRGQELAQIFDISKVEIKLPIPVSELAFLDPSISAINPEGISQPLRVDITGEYAGREHQWSGLIQRTSGEIDPRSRMVSLIAEVEDPYGLQTSGQKMAAPLSVGMFVKASIHGRKLPAAFTVPRSAILEMDQVIVLDGEDRITFRNVSIARYVGSNAIIESGLNSGDRVCISRIEVPIAGSQVKPLEVNSEVGP